MKIYARFICSFALILALLVCGLHGTADAKYQVGETQSYRVEISAAGGNDTAIIQREGATFIKVHLEALSLVGSDTLRLFDADGTLQSTYDSSSNGSLWIPSVEGDAATIVLNAPEGSASRAVIDEFGWGFGETEMLSANGYVADSLIIESTCGTDDKRDRECHRGTYRYNEAGSVGRLRFRDDDTGGFFLCTGFLVSYQDHFITNNHCIDTTTEAAMLRLDSTTNTHPAAEAPSRVGTNSMGAHWSGPAPGWTQPLSSSTGTRRQHTVTCPYPAASCNEMTRFTYLSTPRASRRKSWLPTMAACGRLYRHRSPVNPAIPPTPLSFTMPTPSAGVQAPRCWTPKIT